MTGWERHSTTRRASLGTVRGLAATDGGERRNGRRSPGCCDEEDRGREGGGDSGWEPLKEKPRVGWTGVWACVCLEPRFPCSSDNWEGG